MISPNLVTSWTEVRLTLFQYLDFSFFNGTGLLQSEAFISFET